MTPTGGTKTLLDHIINSFLFGKYKTPYSWVSCKKNEPSHTVFPLESSSKLSLSQTTDHSEEVFGVIPPNHSVCGLLVRKKQKGITPP